MCVQLAHCQNLWANAVGEPGGRGRALLTGTGRNAVPTLLRIIVPEGALGTSSVTRDLRPKT